MDEYLSFACRCSDKGKAEIAAVWAWLEGKFPDRDRAELVNLSLYRLTGMNALVEFVADQWGGISAANGEKDPKGHWSTFIQCDDFTDGIAYTYKAWFDRFGDKES